MVDCQTHCVEDTSPKYDRTVSRNNIKVAKRMKIHRKPHTFDPFNSLLILEIRKNFKFACDANNIQKSAATWLFHFLMNKPASIILGTWLRAYYICRSSSRKKIANLSYLNTYQQVAIFQLKKLRQKKIIAKIESAITRFVHHWERPHLNTSRSWLIRASIKEMCTMSTHSMRSLLKVHTS